MKKLLFSALLLAIALMSLRADAYSLRHKGPVTLDLTVYQSTGSSQNSITNQTGATTNILDKYKEYSKEFTLNNEFFLKLLENSFDTNFPAGTHLVTDGFTLYVVDTTGTNVVFDISPVLTVVFSVNANSSTYDQTEKITLKGTNYVASGSGTSHGYVTFNYSDSTLTTRDATHTVFEFDGLSTSQNSDHYTDSTGKNRSSFLLKGAGSGTIQGAPSVLGGTIIGSASGPAAIAVPTVGPPVPRPPPIKAVTD